MTFNEWWEQHPYRYADSAEELKESCKMAWDSAFAECAKARFNSLPPIDPSKYKVTENGNVLRSSSERPNK